jgi:6-phosphofructokinase 2
MNPSLDRSAEVEKIEPIHKLRCHTPRRDPGGGGVNVARVLRRLGGDVTAVMPLGGGAGALIDTLLRHEGIQTVPVAIAGETRENFTALERSSCRQYRFVMPGPMLTPVELDAICKALDLAHANPEYVVASGSLPPGTPTNFYAGIAKQVKALGRRFILDSSGDALRDGLGEGVWLIKPNLRELAQLTGETLSGEAEWTAAARRIIAKGGAEIVALSLGERGARLIFADAVWAAHAPPISPASTVGAGDSFVGALTWAFARGDGPREALRHAVAAGTAALLSHGTELCHTEAVEQLLPQVVVDKLPL